MAFTDTVTLTQQTANVNSTFRLIERSGATTLRQDANEASPNQRSLRISHQKLKLNGAPSVSRLFGVTLVDVNSTTGASETHTANLVYKGPEKSIMTLTRKRDLLRQLAYFLLSADLEIWLNGES